MCKRERERERERERFSLKYMYLEEKKSNVFLGLTKYFANRTIEHKK